MSEAQRGKMDVARVAVFTCTAARSSYKAYNAYNAYNRYRTVQRRLVRQHASFVSLLIPGSQVPICRGLMPVLFAARKALWTEGEVATV